MGSLNTKESPVIENLISGKYVSAPLKLVSIPIEDAKANTFLSEYLKDVPPTEDYKLIIYNTTRSRNPQTAVFGMDVFNGITAVKSIGITELPYELVCAVMDALKITGEDRFLYEDEIVLLSDLAGLNYEDGTNLFCNARINSDISVFVPFLEGSISEIILQEKLKLVDSLDEDLNFTQDQYEDDLTDVYEECSLCKVAPTIMEDDYDIF